MSNTDLSHLDAPTLKLATLEAAKDEKSATQILLSHLAEVDRRWLYAEWGYSSLHVYIRDALGFSDNQAYERANAARLLRKVPEVREALEKGTHTLTSAAKISSFLSREKSTKTEALDLLSRCENLSTREIERVLVEDSTQTVPKPEKVKPVSGTLTCLQLEVDAEFMALVERIKELKGNPAITLKDLFQAAMEEFAKKREPKPKNPTTSLQNPGSPQKKSRSRYIPVQIQNPVIVRSEDRCEYVDPVSGKRCDSRMGLQFDHYPIPWAMGGESTVENLRRVCPTHNRLHAKHAYGSEKMRPYLRN